MAGGGPRGDLIKFNDADRPQRGRTTPGRVGTEEVATSPPGTGKATEPDESCEARGSAMWVDCENSSRQLRRFARADLVKWRHGHLATYINSVLYA